MTDQELIDSQELDDKATMWVNEVVPGIYEMLEKADITYNDEIICHLLSDGFKIGYATLWRELKDVEVTK